MLMQRKDLTVVETIQQRKRRMQRSTNMGGLRMAVGKDGRNLFVTDQRVARGKAIRGPHRVSMCHLG